MSLPKHDPGLAKFLSTLDPSMYTITGGPEPTPPTAKAVENLKEQQEYQWYQDSMSPTPIPSKIQNCFSSDINPYQLQREIEITKRSVGTRYRHSPSKGSILGASFISFIVGAIVVLVVMKILS